MLDGVQVVSADTLPLKGWRTAGAADLLMSSTCFSASSYRQDKDGATTGELKSNALPKGLESS